MKKRLLVGILILTMLVACLNVGALAAEASTVAEVNSLQELKEAITNGDKATIKLTGNITDANETIVITRSLTLDLNEHTISGAVTPTTGVIQVTGGNDVAVTIMGPGTIKNTGTTAQYKPGLWDVYNGSIVAVSASNKATLTLDGGVVLESASPSTDVNTGILYADNATLDVKNATINVNNATYRPISSKAIPASTIIVSGGEFKGFNITLDPVSNSTMLDGRFSLADVAAGKAVEVTSATWSSNDSTMAVNVKVSDSAPTDYIASRVISGKTVYVTSGDIGVLTADQATEAANTVIEVKKDAQIHTTLKAASAISHSNTLKFNIAAGATVSGEIKVPQYGRVEYSGSGSIDDIVKPSEGYKVSNTSGAMDVVATNVAVMVYNGNTLVNNYTAENAANAFSQLATVTKPVIKVVANTTIKDAIRVNKDMTVEIAEGTTLTATFHSFDSHTLTLDGEGTLKAKDGTNDLAIACGLTESSTGSGTPATFDSTHHGSAVIGKDVTVEGAVAVFNKDSRLDVYGTVTTSGLAISGNGGTNGDENHGGTEIVIHKSATVKSTDSAAIYHPQVGTLTIGCDDADCANADAEGANTGAVIEGQIAVAARAGTIMVKGGTITSKAASAIKVNGIDLYPAGIVADMNEGYSKGSLSITVTGGRIIAVGTHKPVTGSAGGSEQTGTAEDKIIVSGGEFSSEIDSVYLPAGKECKKVGEATYYTIEDKEEVTMVVEVSESVDGKTKQQYASLADAIRMAKPGATITVLDTVEDDKITLTKTVTVAKDITIDLNGKTIEATSVAAFTVTGGKLTLTSAKENGKVTSTAATTVRVEENAVGVVVNKNVTVDGQNGLFAAANIKNDVTFDVNGEVTGTNAAINTNGNITAHTVNININDGAKVTNNQATAIYAAGKSNITVKGGEITGKDAGIEIRSGSLNVTGGTIKATTAATSDATEAKANGAGATVTGAAVAVSPHAGKTVDVTISGGMIEGPSGLYFADTVSAGKDAIDASITGGTFKATNENGKSVGQSTGVAAGTLDGIITGGTYTNSVNKPDAVGKYMDTNVILGDNGQVTQDTALSNRVFPAVLAGKDATGAVSKDPTIASKTANAEGHYLEVKLSIDQLQQHTPNDTQQTTKAYWFGIAVKAPEGAKAVKTAIVKSADKPADFTLANDTIVKIDKEGKVDGVAAYIGYQSIPATLDTFWIEVQWLDAAQSGNVITTDLIKLVPTLTFVPADMTPFEIVKVGFGADPAQVTAAIKAAAKEAYDKWDWSETDVVRNTMYVVYKGGKETDGAEVTLTITNSVNGKTYTETSTGVKHAGSFYDTLNDQLEKLGAGNYTITLTVENGVVATDNTLKIYKIVYKANGGTFTADDKDAAAKVFGDATSTEISFYSTDKDATLTGLVPTNGEKVLKWSDGVASEDGYTITYTAEWADKPAPVYPSYPTVSPTTVEAAKTENGSVKLSSSTASVGTKVTVTVTPDAGYKVESVVVTDRNGDEVEVTKNEDGTYTFTVPAATPVTVTAKFSHICAHDTLSDVDVNQFYHEAVDYMVLNGFIDGYPEGVFKPNAVATRGQMLTIMAAANGVETESDPWYKASVDWAVAAGYSDGTRPTAPIQREEIVTILWQIAKKPASEQTLEGYEDAGSVNEWAKAAMAWAVENGIIKGRAEDRLVPQGTATRAELAQMLYNYFNLAK